MAGGGTPTTTAFGGRAMRMLPAAGAANGSGMLQQARARAGLRAASGAFNPSTTDPAGGAAPGGPTLPLPDPSTLDVKTINKLLQLLDRFIVLGYPAAAGKVAEYLCRTKAFNCTTGECAVQSADGSMIQVVRNMPDEAKNCAVDLRYDQCSRDGWMQQWGKDRILTVPIAAWQTDPAIPGFRCVELVGPQSSAALGWPGLSRMPGHWKIRNIQVTGGGAPLAFALRGSQHYWDPARDRPQHVLQYPDESTVLSIADTEGRCSCEKLEACIPSYGDLTIASGVLRLYVQTAGAGTEPSLSMMITFCDEKHLPATLPVNCMDPPLPTVVPLIP